MSKRPGFMIVQMLIVLGLIGGFVIVADRLFRLSMQTTTQSTRRQEDLIRLGQAIHALRDDVWSATKVEVSDRSTLSVTLASGAVHWKALPDGRVVRTPDGGDESTWNALHLEFARQGPWVVVHRAGSEIALLRTAPVVSGGVK